MFYNNDTIISCPIIVFLIIIENVNAKCGVECGGSDMPLWQGMLIYIGSPFLLLFFCVCGCISSQKIKEMYLEKGLIRDETKTSNIENEGNSKDLELPSYEESVSKAPNELNDSNKITIIINDEKYEASLKRLTPRTSPRASPRTSPRASPRASPRTSPIASLKRMTPRTNDERFREMES